MRECAEAIFAEFWEMSRMSKFAYTSGSHRYPIRQTNSVANLFPIPHRPTKLLLEPAACKSLKILEVAVRRSRGQFRFHWGNKQKNPN